MNLVRWNPLRELEEMSERLDRFLARQDTRGANGKEMMTVADWVPSVDISETDEEFHIEAELPEVKKEDVKVTLENGVLTLQGERKEEREEKGRRRRTSTAEKPARERRSRTVSDTVEVERYLQWWLYSTSTRPGLRSAQSSVTDTAFKLLFSPPSPLSGSSRTRSASFIASTILRAHSRRSGSRAGHSSRWKREPGGRRSSDSRDATERS